MSFERQGIIWLRCTSWNLPLCGSRIFDNNSDDRSTGWRYITTVRDGHLGKAAILMCQPCDAVLDCRFTHPVVFSGRSSMEPQVRRAGNIAKGTNFRPMPTARKKTGNLNLALAQLRESCVIAARKRKRSRAPWPSSTAQRAWANAERELRQASKRTTNLMEPPILSAIVQRGKGKELLACAPCAYRRKALYPLGQPRPMCDVLVRSRLAPKSCRCDYVAQFSSSPLTEQRSPQRE